MKGENPYIVVRGDTSSFFLDTLRRTDGTSGADEAAEMAAHTLCADDARPARGWVEGDGLMSAVHAGGIAPSAADAALKVYFRIDDGVAVEVARQDEVGQLLAYECFE